MERTKKLKQRRIKKAAAKLVSSDVPARTTHSQRKETTAKEAIRAGTASKGTRESTKVKTQQSRLMKSTVLSRKKGEKKAVLTVEHNQCGEKLSARKRMQRLEKKMQQAIPAMNANNGKLLNCNQLM